MSRHHGCLVDDAVLLTSRRFARELQILVDMYEETRRRESPHGAGPGTTAVEKRGAAYITRPIV